VPFKKQFLKPTFQLINPGPGNQRRNAVHQKKGRKMAAKPIMRGFLVSRFKRDMIGTVIVATIAVTIHQLTMVQPHKKRYAEFYKTFDANAVFEDMRKKGCFTSCPAD